LKDTIVDVVHDANSAAVRSKRHTKTVLRALRKGELLGYQRGPGCGWRIFESDLDRWIKGERPARRRAA
jgi:hypothetical protein